MEDYRIITLHDNKLKVFRNGIIQREFVYKYGSRDGKYKKRDIKWVEIGSLHKLTGYYRIKLNTKFYLIHRVMGYAFLGLDIDNPTQIIDHIDRNKTNNNVVNLRIVTKQQNEWNTNSKGYCWDKRINKYQVRICLNNKNISLGCYKTEACAKLAYLTAKAHYHQF